MRLIDNAGNIDLSLDTPDANGGELLLAVGNGDNLTGNS
jgi:hypothetical protein